MKDVRFYQYSDRYYEQMCDLWEQHGWYNPVPKECLPDGYVAVYDNHVIAACFVYTASNAKMAVVDYAILDKYVDKKLTHEALEKVMHFCVEMARCHTGDNGIIMTLSSNPGIVKFNEKVGFIKAESNVTTMIMPVDKTNLDFIKE